jgi:imidazolonepropionase-like amidohydrolase
MTVITIRGGSLFDGKSGFSSGDLVVRDGYIDDAADTDTADAVIDASGCWVVPSLTDAHCHLLQGHLRRLPAFGVGFTVDMFSTPAVRAALDSEALDSGVGYITAGIGAAVRGGHPFQLVGSGLYDDFHSVREAGGPSAFVEAVARSGASFLKVFLEDGRLAGVDLPVLASHTLAALVEEAHDRGLPVVAHATTVERAVEAMAAGVDGLAHAPVPQSARDVEAFVSCARSCSTFVVTTLVATASALGLSQAGTVAESTLWGRVPMAWRQHLRGAANTVTDHDAFDRLLQLVAESHAAAIPLYPGTDAAFPGVMPGLSLHIELELLADCGISSAELLRSATSGIRSRLGIREVSIAPGGIAELLVLSRDPSATISATSAIEWTILGDKVYRLGS